MYDSLRRIEIKCDTEGCPQRHRSWTVQPRAILDGLVTWDLFICTGCGNEPIVVQVISEASPDPPQTKLVPEPAPYCYNCGLNYTRAGTTFVCPSCGDTA